MIDSKEYSVTWSLHLIKECALNSQTVQPFVLQQLFLAAAADSSLLSDCVLECLTARTASFGLEEVKRTKNMVAACLPGNVFFMSTCSVWLCFALWKLNWTWPYLLCKQYSPPCLICAMFTQQTQRHSVIWHSGGALMFQRSVQDASQTRWPLPGTHLNFSSHLLCFSSFPSFSAVASFCTHPARKAGWVITRGLRAGWLPLIESSQQLVFYETALSSQPARTCPDVIKDHTVSQRSLIRVCPTGF